jgi:hypothetical protein
MADKPTIFVAYPYAFKKADYRAPFKKVAREYGVEFTYADQKITAIHILEKIIEMMEVAEFSLFDITTWNANVALELGVAMGRGFDYYILFNPENEEGDVPADLGGIDRLQWTSHAELQGELSRLMRQQFGAPAQERDEKAKARGAQVTEHLEAIGKEIPDIVKREPGMAIGGIASSMGVPIDVAKSLVRPLVDSDKLKTEGVKRGMKYFPPDK